MASTLTVQKVVDQTRVYSDLFPVDDAAGYTQEPALTIAQDLVQKIFAQTLDWKFNQAYVPHFLTVALQQDYVTNVTDMGWLEQAWRIDINNSSNGNGVGSSSPKPIISMEAVRQLQQTSYQASPFNISWIPNNLAQLGTWVANTSYPCGYGQSQTPSSPIQQFLDSNGNILYIDSTVLKLSINSPGFINGPIPPIKPPNKLLASDNFVRPNQDPIGAPWVMPSGSFASGQTQLLNNAVCPVSSAVQLSFILNSSVTWPTDQYSQATINQFKNGAGYLALVLRCDSTAMNMYYIDLDGVIGGIGSAFPTPLNLQKVVNGVFQGGGPFYHSFGFVTPNIGDVFSASIVGSLISVYQNGNLVGTFIDTNLPIASGSAGLLTQTVPSTVLPTDVAWTNWSGGQAFVNPYGISGSTQPAAPPSAIPGSTVTDGVYPTQVTWTVADPNGVALRLVPLPAFSGIVWLIRPVYQRKPPVLVSLQSTFAPMPDEYGYLIRQGFMAMCKIHAGAKDAMAAYAGWEEMLFTALRAGDRERDDTSFYPSEGLTGGGVFVNGSPIGPAWPWPVTGY